MGGLFFVVAGLLHCRDSYELSCDAYHTFRGLMAKIVQVTMMLELADDAIHPDNWECWPEVMDQMPNVEGFCITGIEIRPYTCMEDDPTNHTKH